MGTASNSSLTYKHIAHPTKEILSYIDNRRKGNIRSLSTRWKKFNDLCMGGIEPNTIYTIAGISGSGKSAFSNSLETDLFELNPDKDFVVLSFNFEMLSSKQVGRKLSHRVNKTTQQLYSGKTNQQLSDSEYNQVVEEAKNIKEYPIYYVDTPGTVDQIRNTIISFSEQDF